MQHSTIYMHTYMHMHVKVYVHLYVVGKLVDTHAQTRTHTHRETYTRTQTTHVVRKFRAFCLRESVRDCRLCASCNWKWASARYAPLAAPLHISLTDQSTLSNLRSCCFFHILAFCSLLYVLFFQTFVLTARRLSCALNCDSYFQCSRLTSNRATHVFIG